MATDVYIKFGTTKETIGPRKTPRPMIEGDSTDDLHYWWCEVRNCGFDLEAKDPEPAPEEGGGKKEEDKDKSKAKFKSVTLKKRVDWASTQLFIKCCEQAMALANKKLSKEEVEKGWIDTITIEVCRPSAGDKVPFVIVEYHGVRLVHYSIDMSGPEPSESVTFEFQKLGFQHTRMDPYTGNVAVKDAITRTGELANSGSGQAGTAQEGASATVGGSTSAAATVAAVVVAPASGGTGSSGASPTPAGPATAFDSAVSQNYPGFNQGPNLVV